MKVASGEIDKYKNTYPLVVEDEVWRTVHVSIFGRSPTFSCSSAAELNARFDLLEYKGGKSFILRRLSQKNYHSQELMAALSKRNVSKEVSERIVQEFVAQGYLNDATWLASFVRVLRCQRFGFKAILLKLMHKGIPKEEALEAISLFQENEGEVDSTKASIEQLLQTRYRNRQLTDRKERDKVIAALMRKGYELNEIFEVLKKNLSVRLS